MSEYTIKNDILTVKADSFGARLTSVYAFDTQYLWQKDPAWWDDQAPVLFPFVGRLFEGAYTMDGDGYTMPIHGIAPYEEFAVADRGADFITFVLTANERTMAVYPRQFAFFVTYRLEGACVQVCFQVENRDQKPMYFAVGGHPGFNVPLEEGFCFEDYRLEFETPCIPGSVQQSDSCLMTGRVLEYPLKNGCILPLDRHLFDRDSLILCNCARTVTLTCGSKRWVKLSFPQMDYLLLWQAKNAPYVCIEPWSSLPSNQDEHTVFEEKKDLITLKPTDIYINNWSITVG